MKSKELKRLIGQHVKQSQCLSAPGQKVGITSIVRSAVDQIINCKRSLSLPRKKELSLVLKALDTFGY